MDLEKKWRDIQLPTGELTEMTRKQNGRVKWKKCFVNPNPFFSEFSSFSLNLLLKKKKKSQIEAKKKRSIVHSDT